MTLGYGYGTTNNNGNPLSHTIARPGVSTSLSYGYDGANRLGSASQTGTTAWTQTYGFDNSGIGGSTVTLACRRQRRRCRKRPLGTGPTTELAHGAMIVLAIFSRSQG